MKEFTIYTAHPITGLSGEEVIAYYENLRKLLPSNMQMLCPMTGKGYLRAETSLKATGHTNPCSTDHAIFTRDKWMVSIGDIFLCDLTGAKTVSIGCCMELAMANCLGKHVILVMEEGNPHNHSFVKEAANIIFGTLEEAQNYLMMLAAMKI